MRSRSPVASSGPVVVQPIGLVPQGRGLALILADPGGEPLRVILDRRRLGLDAALTIGAALANAVHAQQMVHKDIHPGNVFVDETTGEARLAGFDLATRLSAF
jgi:histidine kinase